MVIDGVYSPDPERLKAIYDETRYSPASSRTFAL
jgi:hypothetical protein